LADLATIDARRLSGSGCWQAAEKLRAASNGLPAPHVGAPGLRGPAGRCLSARAAAAGGGSRPLARRLAPVRGQRANLLGTAPARRRHRTFSRRGLAPRSYPHPAGAPGVTARGRRVAGALAPKAT